MYTIIRKTILLSAVALSFNAFSAGTADSKVDFVQVNIDSGSNSHYGVVRFITKPTGSPSCATDTQGRMIFSLETEGGKAFYSLVLSAKISNSSIWVYGTGFCHSGLELVSYARIK